LRHGGFTSKVRNIFYLHLFCLYFKTPLLFFLLSLILDGCWMLKRKYHRET